jgi:hypothetical protein
MHECALEKAYEPAAAQPLVAPAEPPDALEELFHHNVDQVAALSVPAGSLVKCLLMELERRGTHIKLSNPAPGGHSVDYELLDGADSPVERLARALGFETVSKSRLVVPNG